MLILDTQTNDLERTRFPQDPISHIFKLIIEASTKLLQVKYSTRSGLDTESLDNDKIRRYTTEMREKYLSFWWHSLEGEKDSLKYFKRVIKGLDSRMLTIFLYFVTGSDMTWQITFTNLKGNLSTLYRDQTASIQERRRERKRKWRHRSDVKKKNDPEGNQLSIQRNSKLLQNNKEVLLL